MRSILAVLVSAAALSATFCDEQRPEGTKISDYENYLEDQSLIGKEIACTDAEKECYKFERVLHTDGKCYSLLHVGPCKNGDIEFNKEKAKNGEYKAECVEPYSCGTPSLLFMAYDQTCYKTNLVYDVCNEKKNLTYSRNFFGEGQCVCFGDSCPPRPVVTQPEEAGRCRLPDLVKSEYHYWSDPLAYRVFPCTEKEHECLKNGTMLHEESGQCYPLVEQGPCADGEMFTANRTAFDQNGWLLGACSQPLCPQGQVRMQIDGKCYLEEDALNKMCPPDILVKDVFGNVGCGFKQDLDVGGQLPKQLTHDGKCLGKYRHF